VRILTIVILVKPVNAIDVITKYSYINRAFSAYSKIALLTLLAISCHISGFTLKADDDVKEIEVVSIGDRKIKPEVVTNSMRLTVGRPFTILLMKQDIRRLSATHLFESIKINHERVDDGLKITVTVQPKP
jgi:outer membrane protein assembly factor BamA